MTSTSDVILRTSSLTDAKRFYHDVLGFSLVTESEKLVGFDTGSFVLYFETGEDNGAVFEFEVDDVQATKAKLLAQECVLVEENPAIPRCYMRDRFGLIFNLTPRA